MGCVQQICELVELTEYLQRSCEVLKSGAWVAVFHAPTRIDGGAPPPIPYGANPYTVRLPAPATYTCPFATTGIVNFAAFPPVSAAFTELL